MSEATGGVNAFLFLQPLYGFKLNLSLRAQFWRGEFAPGRGNEQHSAQEVKKHKNANVNISKVLRTFRSHFGARASNRKANRRAVGRSLAATAVGVVLPFDFGGQMIIFLHNNHLFKNSTDSSRR